jgi:hypothetical protein
LVQNNIINTKLLCFPKSDLNEKMENLSLKELLLLTENVHSYLLKIVHRYLLFFVHSYLRKNGHCYLPFTQLRLLNRTYSFDWILVILYT